MLKLFFLPATRIVRGQLLVCIFRSRNTVLHSVPVYPYQLRFSPFNRSRPQFLKFASVRVES